MRTLIKCAIFTMAIAAYPAVTQAAADVNVGDLVKLHQLDGGSGGRFGVKINNSSTDAFNTFCVEVGGSNNTSSTDGWLNVNTNYKVANIATETTSGKTAASGGDGSKAQLTDKVAWMYTVFRTSATDAALRTNLSVTSGQLTGSELYRAIQGYIWNRMDTGDPDGWDQPASLYGAYGATWDSLFSISGWTAGDFGSVRIMQLTTTDGATQRQDQLILIPEAGSVAIWSLFGVGLVGVWYKRRK